MTKNTPHKGRRLEKFYSLSLSLLLSLSHRVLTGFSNSPTHCEEILDNVFRSTRSLSPKNVQKVSDVLCANHQETFLDIFRKWREKKNRRIKKVETLRAGDVKSKFRPSLEITNKDFTDQNEESFIYKTTLTPAHMSRLDPHEIIFHTFSMTFIHARLSSRHRVLVAHVIVSFSSPCDYQNKIVYNQHTW